MQSNDNITTENDAIKVKYVLIDFPEYRTIEVCLPGIRREDDIWRKFCVYANWLLKSNLVVHALLSLFLSVYELIAVCIDLSGETKFELFAHLYNVKAHNETNFRAVIAMMCLALIVCTIVCAMFHYQLRWEWAAPLIYAIVTLELAIVFFGIQFYAIGQYLVFVIIVSLLVTALSLKLKTLSNQVN